MAKQYVVLVQCSDGEELVLLRTRSKAMAERIAEKAGAPTRIVEQ